MNEFGTCVREWQVFYATIAAAAATLVGLLFVSVSLNKEKLDRDENAHLMRLSRHTFGLYLSVIALSLTFLIPRQNVHGLTIPLICIAAGGVFDLVRQGFILVRRHHMQLKGVLRRLLWPGASFTAVIVSAAHIMFRGDTESLYHMVFAMILLLLSAARSSWFLLVGITEGIEKPQGR